MVTKRQGAKQPFDVDAFELEAEASLARFTPEQLDAIHAHAAAQVTADDFAIADEMARRFFERMKDGGKLPRRTRTARRRSP
jgi:hypothetical protein